MVSKFFNIFCAFLSLTTITGQRNFLSHGGGLLDRTFGEKMVLNIFYCEVEALCLILTFSVLMIYWIYDGNDLCLMISSI